jgi:MFS family permease
MSPFCNVGFDVFYEGFAFANNCRFGSARAVNRRYISDCVPAKFTLQASAAFVSASALGMATGPALAGLLEVHTSQFGITLNANTLPGWIMAGGWFLFLVWLWLGFKEPSHHDPITPSSHSSDINRDNADNDLKEHQEEEGILEPFLSKSSRSSVMDANIAGEIVLLNS